MPATATPPATSAPKPLALGRPRFMDTALAELARTQGAAAAWRAALAQAAGGSGPGTGSRPGAEAAARAAAQAEGDFAIGLADAQGRTFLAVDRFAIQTLCWHVIDGTLHFAERADTLATLPPRAEIDPQAIYDYLYFHVVPSPRTIFLGVHRLPPAHCLWFEDGKVTVQPYWLPHFEEPKQADFKTLAAGLRQRIQAAVAAELDGSKPACFLSGGTDSSTVAGMVSQLAGRAAPYSIGFEDGRHD